MTTWDIVDGLTSRWGVPIDGKVLPGGTPDQWPRSILKALDDLFALTEVDIDDLASVRRTQRAKDQIEELFLTRAERVDNPTSVAAMEACGMQALDVEAVIAKMGGRGDGIGVEMREDDEEGY